jgi:hypothetical protein
MLKVTYCILTSYVHYVTYHIVVFSVYLRVTCTMSFLTYCGFVSIPTSYVQYVTFNILWICQYTYLRVTCTTSLLTYCGCVSIITSYVHYVTFKILWFVSIPTSYVHYVTFDIMWALSVYLQVTCNTSLLAYCNILKVT